MHILQLSQRNAVAQQRLLTAAEKLARYFEIDPEMITALSPSSKDPEVRAMKEREAVADLLEAIAAEFGLIVKDDSTVTTVTEEQLHALRADMNARAPTMNKIFDQVEVADSLTTTVTITNNLDDLPEPVLEEPAAIEEAPAEESTPEEPATKKNSRKKK